MRLGALAGVSKLLIKFEADAKLTYQDRKICLGLLLSPIVIATKRGSPYGGVGIRPLFLFLHTLTDGDSLGPEQGSNPNPGSVGAEAPLDCTLALNCTGLLHHTCSLMNILPVILVVSVP